MFDMTKLGFEPESLEKFEEANGWVELEPGTHTVSNRITLRRGEDTYLQFRR